MLWWFSQDIIEGQIMSCSLVSMCSDDCNIPVTSCFLYICDLTPVFVCFAGWSTVSCGLTRGSLTFGHELLAS